MIDGTIILLNKYPKRLGINFDPLWCFNNQAAELIKSSSKRLPMMKAVRSSSWGFDKETLILTYNTFVKPVFSYAPVIWVPNTKKTNMQHMQRVQNSGMHLITGCHLASSEDLLHYETGLLPVADGLDMLCTQYLASAMQNDHPSHKTVTRPSGPRRVKETLQSKYMRTVQPYLSDGVIKEIMYKKTLNAIHTSAVSAVISKQTPNKVLQCHPPAISASESKLSQALLCTLCQLCDNRCDRLKTYLFWIKKANDDLCPECQTESHSTNHLF
jgi:hypothetical protein